MERAAAPRCGCLRMAAMRLLKTGQRQSPGRGIGRFGMGTRPIPHSHSYSSTKYAYAAAAAGISS
ncbi:hypothetical protein IG631_14774 [Alternaria alternata]|nr:hypothetical protein IG631_14774 [Alternaria alternata]